MAVDQVRVDVLVAGGGMAGLAAASEAARLGAVVGVVEKLPETGGSAALSAGILWNPRSYDEIKRAGARILGFHVSDWLVPTPAPLMGRGVMGDGVIELHRLRSAVDAVGYGGPIEVEIFNQVVWDMPLDEMLPLIRQRFAEHV
jgi:NADPH-dependent 2,4-dienoyl-CoA reductase/sulfur reductase-like enzyme